MEKGHPRVQNAEKNVEKPCRLKRMPDNSRSPASNRRRRRRRSPEYRDWAHLPRDVLSLIFRKLRALEVLGAAQAVCSAWRQLSFDPQIWRCIDMRSHADLVNMNDVKKMSRMAVDRSAGHVEEFYAEGFASDRLFRYIALRTTGLRCLALISVDWIWNNRLPEFVCGWPLLEELQIINCYWSFFVSDTIGAIGRARPELKRFCFNTHQFELNSWFTETGYGHVIEALEIADNMPSLRELQLIGNRMTNEGLTAILDKCLLLESLDIRACFNLTLDEGLQARLARIRNVRLPNDSTADYQLETANYRHGYSYDDYDSY